MLCSRGLGTKHDAESFKPGVPDKDWVDIDLLIGNLAYAFGNCMRGNGKLSCVETLLHIDLALVPISVQGHRLEFSAFCLVLSCNCSQYFYIRSRWLPP